MNTKWQIPRRTFLKGLGTAVALPVLDAMLPVRAFSAVTSAASQFPKRTAFLYVPNGANMADWTPTAVGNQFELPYILQPLKALQKDFSVLTGLTCDKARPNGDGAGDHARAQASFLTGAQARKTNGASIKVGVSADQVAAQKVGKETRFASLELGCERGLNSGNCDSGYSCAYSANMSWQNESTPMAKEVNPRQVFERLFGNAVKGEEAESRARRERYQKSILDFVMEDAKQLKANLGYTDQRKVEEYLTAVREMEQRLQRIEHAAELLPGATKPNGIPKDYQEHIRLMYDMLVLAFQSDTTRISTFMIANDGNNRAYPLLGVSEGHHELSHHGGSAVKKEKIAKINHFHTTQLAYFLERLKSVKEGDGTLLDNCLIAYGSGISDGDRHNHDDLPVLLAGRGGGTLNPGRHVRYAKNTPLTNLWLSMINRMGANAEKVGDSTGVLQNI